jgi:Na+-driven multidrug efflux pump
MIVLALTQMLGVGTTTLMSQAAGRKDQAHAELRFDEPENFIPASATAS